MAFTPAPWPRKLRSQEWWGGTSRDNMGWERKSFTFTATSTQANLTFSATENNPYGPALDNVSLSSMGVPEPSTWALMILGFGLTGAALRRRSAKATLAAA